MAGGEFERVMLQARREITEHIIHEALSRRVRDPATEIFLRRISEDEFRHYSFWRSLTSRG
ncbi:MAG: hypothetical protein KIH01_00830 [Candidatus Freyarchaeota archaeon]|nr:hypothetical protein [Candidatus Jordarchaeia archaeon]